MKPKTPRTVILAPPPRTALQRTQEWAGILAFFLLLLGVGWLGADLIREIEGMRSAKSLRDQQFAVCVEAAQDLASQLNGKRVSYAEIMDYRAQIKGEGR